MRYSCVLLNTVEKVRLDANFYHCFFGSCSQTLPSTSMLSCNIRRGEMMGSILGLNSAKSCTYCCYVSMRIPGPETAATNTMKS